MQPKVDGTWNLHTATTGTTLDFFVMVGSLAGTAGSRTQANYGAANSFMDAFTQYRRQQGLAASVMNLGAVEDIGMVSRHPEYLQNVKLAGMPLLCEKDVLDGLQAVIQQSSFDSGSGILAVGLGHTRPISDTSTLPMWGRDARFSVYANLQSSVAVQAEAKEDRLRALLTQVDQDPSLLNGTDIVVGLRREIGKAIAENVLPGKELDEEEKEAIIIDSLMAIEIKNWVRRAMKVEVTLKEIGTASKVGGLSDLVLKYMKVKYKMIRK